MSDTHHRHDNSFLAALTNAGIGYNDPASTEHSDSRSARCWSNRASPWPSVYSTVSNNGINPDMAAFFTGIAISMYCPSMMSSIGNGTFLELVLQALGPQYR